MCVGGARWLWWHTSFRAWGGDAALAGPPAVQLCLDLLHADLHIAGAAIDNAPHGLAVALPPGGHPEYCAEAAAGSTCHSPAPLKYRHRKVANRKGLWDVGCPRAAVAPAPLHKLLLLLPLSCRNETLLEHKNVAAPQLWTKSVLFLRQCISDRHVAQPLHMLRLLLSVWCYVSQHTCRNP